MKRRDFLKGAGLAGGGVLLGWHCGRNLFARSQLEERLLGEAEPIVTGKAVAELKRLPAKGLKEIETWFHGPCLNSAEFAFAVTSDDFQQTLARCESREEQELHFLSAFLTHVASEAEIFNRVRMAAEELGGTLDIHWEECCQSVSERWNVHIRSHGFAVPEKFAASLEPLIRAGLDDCLELARASGQRPALSHTAGSIGESAILLLPLAGIPAVTSIVVPVFVGVSVAHLYSYFRSLLNEDRAIDFVRKAVSARLASLASRMGAEFESEIRAGIGILHGCQQQAIASAAASHAENAVPLLH